MKKILLPFAPLLLFGCDSSSDSGPTQADQVEEVIFSENDNHDSVFISQLEIDIPTRDIASVGFSIMAKPDHFAQEISATYALKSLMHNDSYLKLPIWGMYSGYDNTLDITFSFNDGSTLTKSINVDVYNDPLNTYDNVMTVSNAEYKPAFNYFLINGDKYALPIIMDIDGEVRWAVLLICLSV